MFFIMGVSSKGKDIDFTQTTICQNCSAFGRLEVILIQNLNIVQNVEEFYNEYTQRGSNLPYMWEA